MRGSFLVICSLVLVVLIPSCDRNSANPDDEINEFWNERLVGSFDMFKSERSECDDPIDNPNGGAAVTCENIACFRYIFSENDELIILTFPNERFLEYRPIDTLDFKAISESQILFKRRHLTTYDTVAYNFEADVLVLDIKKSFAYRENGELKERYCLDKTSFSKND